MKIGVISDTHGEIGILPQAVRILDGFDVGLIIHCGDVGRGIVPLLEGHLTHFVAGNIDDVDQLREDISAPEHIFHEQLGELEVEGRRIAFLHGNDVKLLHHTIRSEHWDLVCHGHTHDFSSNREGQTLVINPGALSRTPHPSLAVVDLASMEVTEVPL
jgi:uncharacterized protein